MAIVITKGSVRRSLEQWFIAARAGQTLSAVETAKLSAADAAAQSSDYVFDLLSGDEDAFQHEPSSTRNDYVDWIKEFLDANPRLWAGKEGSALEIALQVLEDYAKSHATQAVESAGAEDFFVG